MKNTVFVVMLTICMAFTFKANGDTITDFSSFQHSGNMLASGSHNRELNFTPSGTSVTINTATPPTNGSVSQAIWASSDFQAFNTAGLRLQGNFNPAFTDSWENFGGSSERFGLVVASSIPTGSQTSDVRTTAGGMFVWGIRSGNALNSYLYTGGGTETNADAGTNLSGPNASALAIFMEYTDTGGGSGDQSGWNLGFVDSNGDDQILQFRNTVNGTAIDADGSVIGLYADIRNDNSQAIFSSIEYGFNTIPEPSSCLVLGLGAIGLAWRRRR